MISRLPAKAVFLCLLVAGSLFIILLFASPMTSPTPSAGASDSPAEPSPCRPQQSNDFPSYDSLNGVSVQALDEAMESVDLCPTGTWV